MLYVREVWAEVRANYMLRVIECEGGKRNVGEWEHQAERTMSRYQLRSEYEGLNASDKAVK